MRRPCTCGSNSPKFSGHKLDCALRVGRPNVQDFLDLASKKFGTELACPSCLTCYHFDEKTELCQLYKQRPPARVIAFGCISWEDVIPF